VDFYRDQGAQHAVPLRPGMKASAIERILGERGTVGTLNSP
jgi:hypothetical protein